jgi:hypothetical protein
MPTDGLFEHLSAMLGHDVNKDTFHRGMADVFGRDAPAKVLGVVQVRAVAPRQGPAAAHRHAAQQCSLADQALPRWVPAAHCGALSLRPARLLLHCAARTSQPCSGACCTAPSTPPALKSACPPHGPRRS